MNDETSNLDQTDEDILTYRVSDEALEAGAGTEGMVHTLTAAGPLCFCSAAPCH